PTISARILSTDTREPELLPAAAEELDPAGRPFPGNSAVRHSEWGVGTVMSYERDRMVVLFDEVGYKTLSVPIVRKGGLLVAQEPRPFVPSVTSCCLRAIRAYSQLLE